MYGNYLDDAAKIVAEKREENLKFEHVRLTAEEKDEILKEYHPDRITEQFTEIKIGPNKGEKAPTVAIIFGGGDNFMLATETSYLGDLVKTVGGENITSKLEGDMSSAYVPFSLEQILEQNPDYVLRFAHGNIEETKKSFDDAFDKNPAYKELDAYKNGKVVDLDPSIFNVSANLQVKEAIKTLGNVFYGK
jgi:iron complex transport system substrate-binding protein